MQAIMVFTLDRDVLSVNAMQVVQQIFSVTRMECAHVRTAPLVQSATCVVKTSSISLLRDASKYWCYCHLFYMWKLVVC